MKRPKTPSPGPPALPDVYYLKNLEQLEALAEPLRYRTISLLSEPSTCAQLARHLGISRAKAHYHLKLLERVGLIHYHGEGISHGIVEKYYVVVGRMLDFSRLMPPKRDLNPDGVTLSTYRAVAAFLATMLNVSRETILRSSETIQSGLGLWFDFESALTPEQFAYVRDKLKALEQEIMTMSTGAEKIAKEGKVVKFHTTIYLTPLSAPPPETTTPARRRTLPKASKR